MRIDFDGEAYETCQRIVNELQGFTVEITPVADEGKEPFDAQLLGPDPGSDWGDAVRVRPWNDEIAEPEGDAFTVRAETIKVY